MKRHFIVVVYLRRVIKSILIPYLCPQARLLIQQTGKGNKIEMFGISD